MQSRLAPADARLLKIAAAVGAILLVATLFVSPSSQRGNSPIPSTYSSDPDGALAAFLVLQELHRPVRRWEQSPSELAGVSNDSILILAEPTEEASAADRKALLEYTRRGGRILFCGPSLEKFLPLPHTSATSTLDWKSYPAKLPSSFTWGADTILMRPRAHWDASDSPALPLYADETEPIALVSQLGEGQVIWWAAATPLTNIGISQAQDFRALLNAVSKNDGTPLTIYWDEYFHGQQLSLWSYVERTPLPWGIWQLVLVSVVLLLAFSRRRGPIVLPAILPRLSPLEFVDTMGDLYSRAGATSVAVEVPYQRLRLQLARKLGRSSASTNAELSRAAALSLGLPEGEILQTLNTAGTNPRPSGRQALEIVQKLVRYSHQLSMPHIIQEKKT